MQRSAPRHRRKPKQTIWARHRSNAVAIATVLGTATAIVGVWLAYQSFRDAGTARKEDQTTQATVRLRSQAEQVSAAPVAGAGGFPLIDTAKGPITRIVVDNRSSAPVTRAVVSLVLIQGGGARTGRELSRVQGPGDPYQRDLIAIPPGRSFVEVSGGWAGMGARPGVEIAFTDADGHNWVRASDGSLRGIAQAAPVYYGLAAPLDWQEPELAR